MLVKDSGISDKLEVIHKTPTFCVARIRMKKLDRLENLGGLPMENVVAILDGEGVVIGSSREKFGLGAKDMCYLPAYDSFEVERLSEEAIIILAEASTDKRFPSYVKRFKEMHCFMSGYSPYARRVYVGIGEDDEADHLLAGYTEGSKGNWTSWPPHRHDEKPEVYIYYGMDDGYGLQMLVTEEREEIYKVENLDALIIERGYHQNVAIPTCGINYLWIIYAEAHSRNLNVQVDPRFREISLGETHLCIE